ncbi:MAG: c-type cytochrome biogenesis protein CcmI [Gammaproteobacteria bacterium]
MLFWATAASMIALGLSFVLPPLLGKRRSDAAQQDELNVNLFKQRSRELEADLKNGVISQTQFDSALQDLEVELAADLDVARDANEPTKSAGSGAWLSALGVAFTVSFLTVVIYANLGTSDPEEAQRLAEASNPETGQQPDIGAMVAGLQARLQAQPDDVEGWMMLGRSLVVMERYDEALGSYEQAIERFPGNADLLASFAEASGLSKQGNFTGRARELLRQALAIEPDNTRALWFAGLGDFQAGAFPDAIGKWERLSAAFPKDSQEHQLVQTSIERARTNMSGEAAPAPDQRQQIAESSGGSSQLTVEVSLADSLTGKVSGDDVLFIFARAVEGPRMPLAVVKKQVKDLPLSVQLSDSQAMTPAMKLSKFTEVELTARVSKSGQPTPGSGDLQGIASPVDTATREPVKLVVDSEIP